MSYNLESVTPIAKEDRSPFAILTSNWTGLDTASNAISLLQYSSADWVSIGTANNISSSGKCFHRAEFSCHSSNTSQYGGLTKFGFYPYTDYTYMHLGGNDLKAGYHSAYYGQLGSYSIGNSSIYGMGSYLALNLSYSSNSPYSLTNQRKECSRSLVKRLGN